MQPSQQLSSSARKAVSRIYLVAGGSLILLSLAFYLVGFRPLATALHDEHAQRIDISLNTTLQLIRGEIEKHQSLAEQIASRSAIREQLRQYQDGEITLEALRRFSLPKLTDAIRAHSEIVGMTRLGLDGRRLVDAGLPAPDAVADNCQAQGADAIHLLSPIVIGGEHRLVYCSPLASSDGTHLGTDVLIISESGIRKLIESPARSDVIHFAVYDHGRMIYPREHSPGAPFDALRAYRAGMSPERTEFLIRDRTFDNCDWRLYAVIDEEHFFSDINWHMGTLLGGLAATALLLFALTVRVLQPVIHSLLREEELIERSHRDGLTGLYNHIHLKESLQRELARSRRYGKQLSLLMLDLDYFKAVNDTYGHLAGDDVLRTVADILSDNTRQQDIVGRYGGEEFIVILPETDRAGAERMAERIRLAVETATTTTEGGEIHITVSIGACTCAGEELPSAERFIAQADRALYASKCAGRNRTTHAATMTD